ncbi:MAG: alpha-1,4-glucan--maltose-1-phosphate maltosyltransferase [Acidimicrobiales bacterium]
MTGRLVIEDIRPRTPNQGYSAKAVVGEAVEVRAVIFKDGHDILAGQVKLIADGRAKPQDAAALVPLGNDEWAATVVPRRLGRHQIVVAAWTDRWATWAHKVQVKLEAGQDVDVEIAEGILLLGTAKPARKGRPQPAVAAALAALHDETLTPERRLVLALGPSASDALSDPHGAPDLTTAAPQALWVDRERALVGAWYELFPRSWGGFKGVEERLPALAEMGFDVLYLPPIHPIGVSYRKGANNALVTGIDDPGSPWAIGSAEGGHTDIAADLGTPEDFAHMRDAAAEFGLEVALDYALQCSPDHPWVSEHPEWFHHRPDGSIAYAENPPKKYQDIVPLDFWPEQDEDRVALWQACKAILDFWIARGIRIFRVDNPHTKPVAFWEWLIPAVQAKHPDVIFLAEAFTRPKVMAKLAEVGFSQSYTYFTWRTGQHGPEGLWAYLEELAHGPTADYLRPNFWPNTPDILSGPLRDGPPAAFAMRAVLAATLSPSWGVYSGYELCENQPASATNEEYLDSEKYQIRPRDFDRPDSLAPFLGALNRVRRAHPALQRLRSIRFHPSDNPAVIAYSKLGDERVDGAAADAVLVVVNLDPRHAQDSTLHLDLDHLGLPDDRPFYVRDELSEELYFWTGPSAFVRLEPWLRVAHVFDLRSDPTSDPAGG